MTRKKNILLYTTLGLLGLALAIQFVPYGHAHHNPPISAEPNWDSDRTRELAQRACFDCHSNETTWPWYSHVAPASWLVQSHVDEGRDELNFSEWARHLDDDDELEEIAEEVLDGDMPPWDYALLHPEARLTDAEKQELANGLMRTLAPRGLTQRHR